MSTSFTASDGTTSLSGQRAMDESDTDRSGQPSLLLPQWLRGLLFQEERPQRERASLGLNP